MPSNHLILCHPLFLLSIFCRIRVFSNESALHIRWPKYWSFSFSISPSNEYSGLISFRIDWFDLLAVQETHKSLRQYHSLKASFLHHSAFFMIQLSPQYITSGKTIALTICKETKYKNKSFPQFSIFRFGGALNLDVATVLSIWLKQTNKQKNLEKPQPIPLLLTATYLIIAKNVKMNSSLEHMPDQLCPLCLTWLF